jgi:hypothetical protein
MSISEDRCNSRHKSARLQGMSCRAIASLAFRFRCSGCGTRSRELTSSDPRGETTSIGLVREHSLPTFASQHLACTECVVFWMYVAGGRQDLPSVERNQFPSVQTAASPFPNEALTNPSTEATMLDPVTLISAAFSQESSRLSNPSVCPECETPPNSLDLAAGGPVRCRGCGLWELHTGFCVQPLALSVCRSEGSTDAEFNTGEAVRSHVAFQLHTPKGQLASTNQPSSSSDRN